MSQIIIKELYDSDTILQLVEKTNYNFDQLLAAGGGPAGPAGSPGPTGPAGSRGIRGNEWFATDGTATGTTNNPTDGELRDNDFRIETDGNLQYYLTGSSGPDAPWVDSGLNIRGATGPTGPAGAGAISILHAQSSSTTGSIVPNGNIAGKLTLYDYLVNLSSVNDRDDADTGSVGYINSGLDYTLMGHGNNSIVIGRYKSMFNDNGTFEPKFSSFPTEEEDVPMLIVSQNDYKNPKPTLTSGGGDPLTEFTNGLAIGLNLTHGTAAGDYDPIYSTSYFKSFESFTKLGVINRNFDFAIKSAGHIELRSIGSNKFRLSAGYSRAEIKDITDVKDWSNLLNTDTYTEFDIGDNFAITDDTTQDPTFSGTARQLIASLGRVSISSNSSKSLLGSLLTDVNATVIGRDLNSTVTNQNANEIIIVNDKVTEKETRADKYNNRRRILDKTYDYRINNTYKDTQLRLGQSRIPISNSPKNIFYLGQSYDTPLIGYSSFNFRIPTGSYALGATASAFGMLPSDYNDLSYLGYNILDGFAPGGFSGVQTDKSLSRIGIFPGFFNQERDATGALNPSDSNKDNNLNLYIDEGHKKLPTGSLDLYGTVRIREYGLAENKKGDVAVNAGHGIVKWEKSTNVGLPGGSIIMVGEIKMSSFNFFTKTNRAYGSTGSNYLEGSLKYWSRTGSLGGPTGANNIWSQAFPGKGSNEFKGYYICNGAILADTRDIFARGAFSTVDGINAYTSDIPMPGLVVNDNFKQYDTYTDTYAITTTAGAYIETGASFKNKLIAEVNNLTSSSGNEGLSLLAPRDTDSGFRVVLPNYFGRFPKQVFPSSQSLALNNRDSDEPETSPGIRPPVTSYYRQNAQGTYIINPKYPLKSGFYDGGFPYIRNEELPVHQHFMGKERTKSFLTSVSGVSSASGFITYYKFDDIQPSISSDAVATTSFPTQNALGDDADKKLSASNDTYYIKKDWALYDDSNWINDETIDGLKSRSQKFHDPVFKGTYFAINLRGIENPGRSNTVIEDFDFVAGVPMSGYRNNALPIGSNGTDLSWYGNASDILSPAVLNWGASNKGKGEEQIKVTKIVSPSDTTVLSTITPKLGDEAIAEFEVTWRNENTMHPVTLYDESKNDGEASLDSIYENIYKQPEI